jgi:hypothetical protein
VKKVEVIAFGPRVATPPALTQPPARAMPGGGNTPGPGAVPYRETGVVFAMTATDGFEYSAEVPVDLLATGALRYHIALYTQSGVQTFPSGLAGVPADWDFYGDPWQTRVVPADAPILLFDAAVDASNVTSDFRDVRYELVPSERPGTHAMEVGVPNLERAEHDHSFRCFFKPKIQGRAAELRGRQNLVCFARSTGDRPIPLQLALVTADGVAYGGIIIVTPKHGTFIIPISALKQVRTPNIPHGYPTFIPFWSKVDADIPLDLNRIEAVLVSLGPGVSPSDYASPHGVQIERIWLE